MDFNPFATAVRSAGWPPLNGTSRRECTHFATAVCSAGWPPLNGTPRPQCTHCAWTVFDVQVYVLRLRNTVTCFWKKRDFSWHWNGKKKFSSRQKSFSQTLVLCNMNLFAKFQPNRVWPVFGSIASSYFVLLLLLYYYGMRNVIECWTDWENKIVLWRATIVARRMYMASCDQRL